MAPPIKEIIDVIAELSLKEALIYLTAKGIYDYSKKGYEQIKKIIRNKYNEGKYCFVPDKKEALHLLEFGKSPQYIEMKLLVPNYRYIDILRTGLLIEQYHKKNTPYDNRRIKEIKMHICNKPNGKYFLKLANLPTTPFFSVIISYIHDLKMKGYSPIFLEEKFDEIVQNWEKSSKFTESTDEEKDIILFCNTQMENKNNYFFILGMKKAAETVENAIDYLEKNRIFSKNKYTSKEIKIKEGNQPRIEVTIFREDD